MNPTIASVQQRPYSDNEADSTYRKIFWRIIPFLIICYLFNFLDRINVAFAKLQFTHDLHFSEAVYGLGSGIFYIGYSLFEVPSNIMLDKICNCRTCSLGQDGGSIDPEMGCAHAQLTSA